MIGVEEIDRGGLAGKRAVEIARRAHDDDAGEIRPVVQIRPQHRLERGVVLLRRGAVQARAVREQFRGVGEGFAEQGAAVIHVRGGDVAGDHAGSLAAGGVERGFGVVGAVGDGGGAVVQGGGAGVGEGELAQGFVDFEDFGAVDALGVFGWGGAALGDVARFFCGQSGNGCEGGRGRYPVVKLSGISRASNSYCRATWTAYRAKVTEPKVATSGLMPAIPPIKK